MRNKKEEHSLSQHYQNSSYKMNFALKISLFPFCFFFSFSFSNVLTIF